MLISGIRRIWIAAMGVPTGTPLVDLVNWSGPWRVKGGNDPAYTPNSVEDGLGRPMQSSTTVAKIYETPDISGYDAVKAWEDAGTLVIVAEQKPDGSFVYTQNTEVAARLIPVIDKADFQTLRISVYGTELLATELDTTAPVWAV